MELDCTCVGISIDKWESLMKGKRKTNYQGLIRKIKKHLPALYNDLVLDYYNPFENQCYSTKTHYILTHSMIEYFILK